MQLNSGMAPVCNKKMKFCKDPASLRILHYRISDINTYDTISFGISLHLILSHDLLIGVGSEAVLCGGTLSPLSNMILICRGADPLT